MAGIFEFSVGKMFTKNSVEQLDWKNQSQNSFKIKSVNILVCNDVFVLVTYLRANRERENRVIRNT